MPTTITRVFMNGHSQAVRIPRELRLDTNRVEISRDDSGDLVLHPIPESRGAALLEVLQAFDDDFARLLEEECCNRLPLQERDEL